MVELLMHKTCFKCQKELPLTEFYRHPMMGDGHLNKCKECTKKDSIETYNKKSQDLDWFLKERERSRVKSAKDYERRKGRDVSEYNKRWGRNNRLKTRCHCKVKRAIEAGILIKQPCEVCGNSEAQAHHDDYSKPLEVRWLCVKHHNEHHVAEREKQLREKFESKQK